MRKIFTAFTVVSALYFSAQNISLDSSFGTNGIASVAIAGEGDNLQLIMSQDNHILAFGKDVPASVSIHPNKIYKFSTAGIIDNSFGTAGTLVLPDYVSTFDVVLQGNDKLLVVFKHTNNYNSPNNEKSILRYHLNGTLDTSFGTNGEIKVPTSGDFDFQYSNLVVLSDNSLLLADGVKYVKFTPNGLVDTSYGVNGVVNQINSGNVKLSGNDLLNFYQDKITKTTITGSLVNSFGSAGTFTYPTSKYYNSKLSNSGSINSLDLDGFDFVNISPSGALSNEINLTNDNNTLDYYSDFTSDGTHYFFVGSASDNSPFVVSYSNDGTLVNLNSQQSYKETAIPLGNYTSVLYKDNALYVGGDRKDATTQDWHYVVVKYNFSSLGTSEVKTKKTITFNNPITNNIAFVSSEKVNKIELYSLDGKMIKSINTNNADISELVKGNYIAITYFQDGKTEVQKLLKK